MENHRTVAGGQVDQVNQKVFALIVILTPPRETGLICMSDDPNDKFMADTINAFKATPGAEYELYYGKDFQEKFPYLNFGIAGYGCYDPSGGILMADKALRSIQVNCMSKL